MSVVKIVLYFLAGLCGVGAATCVAMFFMFSSVSALGGAVMFGCFGIAGGLLAIYFDQIISSTKQSRGHAA